MGAGPERGGGESPASGPPRNSAAAAGGGRKGEGMEQEAGEEKSEDALLSIVVDQRERFRKQVGRMEEQNSKLRAELGEESNDMMTSSICAMHHLHGILT